MHKTSWNFVLTNLCSTTKFINMHEVHNVLATKWPPSGDLPSGYLPQAFKKPHPKHVLQYHNYHHLIISPRIASIKVPVPVLAMSRVFVVLSHYDNVTVNKCKYLCNRISLYLSAISCSHHSPSSSCLSKGSSELNPIKSNKYSHIHVSLINQWTYFIYPAMSSLLFFCHSCV